MDFQNWGRIDYFEAWEKQKSLVEKRIRDEISDTIIFCEHNPVITLGRGSQRENEKNNLTSDSLSLGGSGAIPVFEVERGGFATYHGPGQIVVYPIVKLKIGAESLLGKHSFFGGVHGIIRGLELLVCEYLNSKFGLSAQTVVGKTGVWIDGERKISSIGISAKRWVTYHGCSLNLHTDPTAWKVINPCGFESSVMTDLLRETGQKVSFNQAQSDIQEMFNSLFNTR
jgi:lipoate-protein ligase B